MAGNISFHNMYVGIRTFPDITVKSSITALNMYSDWASKSHIHMTMQFRTSVLEFCTFIIIAFSFLHFWDISLLILLNVNVLILLLVTIPLISFSLWQCLSSVQSLRHVQLCDPMDCSMPSFSVHHEILELAQTHDH